jgi:hypothetical protein
MSSLDNLPADQGAVLSLVLQRGRSYDEIAALLGIDRAAVRQRALDGFDALGPSTSVPGSERALLTDYLLGQLPPRVAESVRDGIADSPAQRAWARVIASEISSLSVKPLPEIPVAAAAGASQIAGVGFEEPERAPKPPRELKPPRAKKPPREPKPPREAAGDGAVSSRRGGAILLGLLGVIVVVVVIVLVTSGGGGKTPASGTGNGGTTTGTTTTTPPLKTVAAFDLTPPVTGSKALGVAQIDREGKTLGVIVIATGLKPTNGHDAYGVWLYTGPTHQSFLGYYNGAVSSNGRMEVTSALPPTYKSYGQLLVTLEREGEKLNTPGTIALQGTVK